MKTKTIIFVLVLFSALESYGFSEACEKGTPFYDLSQSNGRRKIGNCDVEIHVCEKRDAGSALPYYLSAPLEDNTQFWVGDVYVKNSRGKSLYMPLYAVESRFPNTTIHLANLTGLINYKYTDKNFDPLSGRKETYELKLFKRRQKIEVSMSSSRESRRNPIRSLFFPDVKITCEK